MKSRRFKVGQHYYPHRVDRGRIEDPNLQHTMMVCGVLDVRVYRMSPTVWNFRSSRINITTTTPETLGWFELSGGTMKAPNDG